MNKSSVVSAIDRRRAMLNGMEKDHRIGGEQKKTHNMKTNKRKRQTNECNELNGSARGLPYTQHCDDLENQSMSPFC